MYSKPLLYQAALNGAYGRRLEFSSGCVTDALFVYLDGAPDKESAAAVDMDFRDRALVCLTGEWEAHVKTTYPEAKVFIRDVMKPLEKFYTCETMLPEGYRAEIFDETAFEMHPFGHGENYATYAEFLKHGAGAVVWYDGRIVASASSFLSLNNEVELDVSTEEAHRRKGLATACVSLMLKDCAARRITVHWDAQNEMSRRLAEKFGFEYDYSYNVYFLPGKL